jgi:hypothetical protein
MRNKFIVVYYYIMNSEQDNEDNFFPVSINPFAPQA